MKAYLLMIRFQLQLSLKKLSIKEDGKISFKRLGVGLLLVLAALSLIGLSALLQYFLLKGFNLIAKPGLILVASTLIVMLFALVYGVFYIISVLYYSKDTSFLSALPIPERAIFTGRIANVLLGECALALIIMGPSVVLYGLQIKAGILFYLQGAITILFTPFIPVMLATFIASLLTRFASLWKRKDLWMVIGVMVALPLAVSGQFIGMQMEMLENANTAFLIQLMFNQQKLLETISSVFPPAYWAISGLSKSTVNLQWFLFIGLSVLGVFLAVFFLGKRYTRLAVLSEEAIGETNKHKSLKKEKYHERKPLKALFLREWKEILKTPAYAMNTISMGIIFPIMMVVMVVALPQEVRTEAFQSGMVEVISGINAYVPFGLLVLIFAACFAFLASINTAVATAVSREGKCHMIYRMIPVSPKTIIQSKFFMGLTLSAFDSIISFIILICLLPTLTLPAVLGFGLAMIFAFIVCAISLIIDMIQPKFDWRTETEVIKRSKNILLSMLVAVAGTALVVAVVYLAYKWLGSFNYAAIISTVLLVALAVVSWGMMMKASVKYYANLE